MRYLLLFVFLLYSVSSFSQGKDKHEAYIDSLVKKQQYEKILPYLAEQLKQQPADVNMIRLIGFWSINLGKLDEGEKYYRTALHIDPKCARCLYHIARVYYMRGDTKQASVLLDSALLFSPNEGDVYLLRGQMKQQAGDPFRAHQNFNKALELQPSNPDYLIARGKFLSERGNFIDALKDVNKAVELAPDYLEAYLARANVYFNHELWDESIADVTQALKLDSNQVNSYTSRAAVYERKLQWDSAYADYTKALKLDPKNAEIYFYRAQVSYKQEDMDGTCKDYAKARSVMQKDVTPSSIIEQIETAWQDLCNSSNPSYYYQRGIAYYNVNKPEKSVAIYSEGLKKFPHHTHLLTFRGNAYMLMKQYAAAITDYYAALEHRSNVASEIQQISAFKEVTEKEKKEYLVTYEASTNVSIAEAFFHIGKYKDALTAINKGMLVNAPDPMYTINVYDIRGNIYMALAQFDEAVKDFDKAIALNPSIDQEYVNRAVARINMVTPVKMVGISFKTANQPYAAQWSMPVKAGSKKEDARLALALEDCSRAIEINGKNGVAYYVRGKIKMLKGEADYCYDLLKAKSLGYVLDANETVLCQ